MTTNLVQAIFMNGVLRPLTPLHLREEEQVTLRVSRESGLAEWEDADCYETCNQNIDESITLEQVQQALAKIPGSLTADFIAERGES